MVPGGKKRQLTGLAILLLGLSVYGGYSLLTGPGNSTRQKALPGFTLVDLQSVDAPFSDSDLPARPFLINAWASWCIPCRTEYQTLRKFAALDLIDIYGLNFKDIQSDATQWLTFYGSVYRKNGYDPDGAVSDLFDISVIPTTILFNAKHRVVYKPVGPLTEENLNDILIPQTKRLVNEASIGYDGKTSVQDL